MVACYRLGKTKGSERERPWPQRADIPPAERPRLVFVLGTGRCGSTLVQEILCRHPEVGFASNLADRLRLPARASRWNGVLYRNLPAAATRKGRIRYAPSESYRAFDRAVSSLLSVPFRDLVAEDVTPWVERQLRAFFLGRAHAQGVDIFLHKLTGWPRVGFLDRIFPQARFIHVVRDGRAVANSWLQMPWWLGYRGPEKWQWGPLPPDLAAGWAASGYSFVLLAGLLWALLLDAYERAAAGLPADRRLQIRYEDVIAQPREAFRRMLDFCGLSWTPGFERGFRRYSFARQREDAFVRDLSAAHVELLTAALRSRLVAHGYAA